MQKSVKKRKREYVTLFSRINNADSKLRTEKDLQRLTNDKQNVVNNRQDKNIEDPKWKKTLVAKDTELELHLKNLNLKQTALRLKLTKIKQDIVDLTAKVETMFTPIEDTFAYKNMMIQIDALKKADAEATTHCSNQRSNRAMIQTKENSDLTVKTSLANNMALEIKEVFAEQTHHHHHPDTIPFNTSSNAPFIVPQLSAKLATLASDLDHLTHRVQKLD